MMPTPIPFNRPCLTGNEQAYMLQAIANGHISGDGAFTLKCHALLKEQLGAAGVLLTTSCTHALEICALLLEIEAGDEVIVPSFTFVSTVNAFVLRGARPIFVDIRPDTLNIDERQVASRITPRTRAIVAVHYAGVGCEMETLTTLATPRIALIEDNAHGLFGRYQGRLLGTFGALAALSFHETKNVSCGEGGALLVNEPRLMERAEIIREKGTDRNRFFRGQVDKYSWVDLGSSYLPSDILAAYLYAQLEAREQIQRRRRRVWERYYEGLHGWARDEGVRLPVIPASCEHPYHMFHLLLPSPERRRALIAHLKARDILSVFHYVPLHLSAMGRRFGGKEGDCPVTEVMSERLLRLPFYNDLTVEDQARVITAIRDFRTDCRQRIGGMG